MPYSAEFPIRKYFTHRAGSGDHLDHLLHRLRSPAPEHLIELPQQPRQLLRLRGSLWPPAPSDRGTRRKSKPKNPKLSLFTRSTTRLLASFSARPSFANSSRSRRSIAVSNHSGRRSPSTRITSRVGRWRGDDQGVRGQAVSPLWPPPSAGRRGQRLWRREPPLLEQALPGHPAPSRRTTNSESGWSPSACRYLVRPALAAERLTESPGASSSTSCPTRPGRL